MARYTVQSSNAACASDTPFAVVDTENNNAVQGCYATEQDAQTEADTLNAGADSGGGSSGDASARGAAWEGIATFLNEPTDEIQPRLIHADGLSFRELPMPLMAMFEDDHGGWGDTTSLLVGRIDGYQIEGNTLRMWGTFDATPEGDRAAEWAGAGTARVSVDTNPKKWRMTAPRAVVEEDEKLLQEWLDGEAEPVTEMPVAEDGRVIVDEGEQSDYIWEMLETEIMGLTMVPFSAFAESKIGLSEGAALVASGARTARLLWRIGLRGAFGAPAQTIRFLNEQGAAGQLEVTGIDADLLADVVRACTANADAADSTGALMLQSAIVDAVRDAGGTVTASDVAREPFDRVEAAGIELTLGREALTASGARMAPDRPPRDWFFMPEPNELTPFTVTDEGQVYGHLAPWEACHLAYPGDCKTPPPSPSGYAYMNRGQVVCDDGSLAPCGPIAAKGPHADTSLGMREAIAHYENTCRIVADARVVDGELGIWCSGSVRPDASADDVRDLRATGECSPDWRWVGDDLEMICALAVILGGYPVPRPTALVADGHVRSLVGVQFGRSEIAEMQERDGEAVPVDVQLQVLAATARGGLSALRELAGA